MERAYFIVFILILVLSCFQKGYCQQLATITEPKKSDRDILFQFPIRSKDFQKVSSPFGYRKHPILQEIRLHAGIDIVAPKGTAVLATATGVVKRSTFQEGYGNFIVITHPDSIKTLYAHLWINLVKEGDRVTQGQLIGFVGATGRVTGPHLHYEIHIKNKKIDPLLVWKNMLSAHRKKQNIEKV